MTKLCEKVVAAAAYAGCPAETPVGQRYLSLSRKITISNIDDI